MPTPLSLAPHLFVIIMVGASVLIGRRRYNHTAIVSGFYAACVIGGYAILSYFLREAPWRVAIFLPAGIATVGIMATMIGSELFWRAYRKIQTQLMQSEKMASLGQLVAGIAHELNTPLGAVKSGQDLYGRAFEKLQAQIGDPKNPETEKLFGLLDDTNKASLQACDRIEAIVKGLRSFARLDEADLQKADIRECLETTLPLIGHYLGSHIHVKREFQDIPPILCYPNQLNQVFLSVLINAAEAIETEGVINIRIESRGDGILVEISDSGVGIPDAHIRRVFDPGFTTKRVKVGTGLGLAISYSIVQDHGGTIEVQNTPGEGTTIRIELPGAAPAARS